MNDFEQAAVAILRSPDTIRTRSQQLYEYVLNDQSPYFRLNLSRLDDCLNRVIALADSRFEDFSKIPFHSRWRHFNVGGVNRLARLQSKKKFPDSSLEQGRVYTELVIVSVLLDAGAGNLWSYREANAPHRLTRSEGLAVASLNLYGDGFFSLQQDLSVDAEALKGLSETALAKAMQVTPENPLSGMDGRTHLLRSLGQAIETQPDYFAGSTRLGGFYDYLLAQAEKPGNRIDARAVFDAVVVCLSSIWPGRVHLYGMNLGDVWEHPAVSGDGGTNGLIPFHKLSQWLTYSLLEPFVWQGYELIRLNELTGLAEYRNGGLLIDSGVIQMKNPEWFKTAQRPEDDSVIEWRALTICLLDELWENFLMKQSLSKNEFPLVKLLEAGTWLAGRQLAQLRSHDAEPPIQIISDGTVF